MPAPAPTTGKIKFWIGFAGGLAPYLLGLATFPSASFNPDTIPPTLNILAKVAGVGILGVIGGLLSYIWDKKENDLKKLFVIGMGAPSILMAMAQNLSQNLPSNPEPRSQVESVVGGAQLGNLQMISLQASNYSPNWQLTTQTSYQEVGSTSILEEILRLPGLSDVDGTQMVIFGSLTLFVLVFLLWRASNVRKSQQALVMYREHLFRANSDLGDLKDKIGDLGLTVTQAGELLEQGGLMEKGLAAHGGQKYEQAREYFTDVIRGVSDAYFYRSLAGG